MRLSVPHSLSLTKLASFLMVKKILMHPRAVIARHRQEDKIIVESIKRNQELEIQYWEDNDKIIGRKKARKEEKESKRLESQMNKEKKKLLLEEETKEIVTKNKRITRVTRKDIRDYLEKEKKNNGNISLNKKSNSMLFKFNKSKRDSQCISGEDLLLHDIPKNFNRMNDDVLSARGVEEAINLLKIINFDEDAKNLCYNPEKRQRAAFELYSEREMVRLKMEKPTLSYSQRQQVIFKNWQKSAENPVYKFQVKIHSKHNTLYH